MCLFNKVPKNSSTNNHTRTFATNDFPSTAETEWKCCHMLLPRINDCLSVFGVGSHFCFFSIFSLYLFVCLKEDGSLLVFSYAALRWRLIHWRISLGLDIAIFSSLSSLYSCVCVCNCYLVPHNLQYATAICLQHYCHIFVPFFAHHLLTRSFSRLPSPHILSFCTHIQSPVSRHSS